jgi:hypothetical protein
MISSRGLRPPSGGLWSPCASRNDDRLVRAFHPLEIDLPGRFAPQTDSCLMPRFHHAQPDDERRQQQQDARFVWKEKKQRGENDREKHHGRDGSNEKGALLFISALPQLTLGTHCSKDDSDQNNAET